MKVDIYNIVGGSGFCFLVPAGVDLTKIIFPDDIILVSSPYFTNIMLPDQLGDLLGVDSEIVSRDIDRCGWSVQTFEIDN